MLQPFFPSSFRLGAPNNYNIQIGPILTLYNLRSPKLFDTAVYRSLKCIF